MNTKRTQSFAALLSFSHRLRFVLPLVLLLSVLPAQGQGVAGYNTGTERVYAFTAEAGGHLWVNEWNGSTWSSADHGAPTDSLAASSAAAITYQEAGVSKTYAFLTARNNHLYAHWHDGTQWNWQDQGAPDGVRLTGTPAAVTYLDRGIQRVYVFVRAAGGQMYVRWWDGANWSWAALGAPAPGVRAISTPAAAVLSTSPLRLYCFVAGDDGASHTVWWNGTQWIWTPLGKPDGVQLSSAPSALTFLDTAVSPAVRKLFVFWAADNGHLYINGWDTTRWFWSDQGTPAGTVVDSSPSAFAFLRGGASLLNAFVTGRDGHLYTNWWDGLRWNWTDQGVTDATSVIGAAAVTAPAALVKSGGTLSAAPSATTLHVLFERRDRRVHDNNWNGSAWLTVDAGSPRAGYARMGAFGPYVFADVSPHSSSPTPAGGADAGGKILSSAVSPYVGPAGEETVYVAAEFSGVWKSTDSGSTWRQSSAGLLSARTAFNNRALALDTLHPSHLLYLSAAEDYRVSGRRLGGLWVSTSSGDLWQHADLPGCPEPNLTEAHFASGAGVVVSDCGLFTSSGASLRVWTRLAPLPEGVVSFSVHQASVFACARGNAYRGSASAAGVAWEPAIRLATPCLKITALPAGGATSPAALVELDGGGNHEIALVNFATRTGPVNMLFANAATAIEPGAPHICCGAFGVFPVRRAGSSPEQFDVFVGDRFDFWQSTSGITADAATTGWVRVSFGPPPDNPQKIHRDTWTVAFSPSYDGARNCRAYATSDGGFSRKLSCDRYSWVSSNQGLHAFKSQYLAGQPLGFCNEPDRHPCSHLYVPSGDNGTWYSDSGGAADWSSLAGGDSGFASVDPSLRTMVHSDRNVWFTSDGTVPKPGAGRLDLYSNDDLANFIGQYPPTQDGTDFHQWAPTGPLPQIATAPGEAPLPFGDFLSLRRPAQTTALETVARSCISRSGSATVRSCPTTSGDQFTWMDISPSAHFERGSILTIAASGGHRNTVIYVIGRLANETRTHIYRGDVDPALGVVTRWRDRSTACADPRSVAPVSPFTLVVDPRRADAIYAADSASQTILSSNDGGACWYTDSALTTLATAGGEFTFQCYGAIGNGDRVCPLQQMLFLPDTRTRIALLFPGGIALSRDNGASWQPMSDRIVPQPGAPNAAAIRDLAGYPMSIYFDPNQMQTGAQPLGGSLYVALLGRGVIRLDVPLP